jgi:putative ABC transport system ATP-binding protein
MIITRELRKNYEIEDAPSVEVLKGIDLEIKDGEFVSLLGPSGSGKSTLLGILAGLDSPTSGSVEIDGTSLTNLSEEAITRFRGEKMGFIFQSYHLIPTLTALENVMVPLELRKSLPITEITKRARALLEQVGLTHRLHHLPKQLSGGEQQRVAIARALVSNPKVIFADEPTGNLDSENGAKVLDYLESLKGRVTIVMVSHDRNLASRADRMISLKDGQVVS